MEDPTHRTGPEASRTAAEWFAKSRGPIGDADREAFEAWRADPENARAYAHVERTWDQSMFLANTPVARRRDLDRARRRSVPYPALAAGLAALLIGATGWSLIDGPASTSAAPEQVSEFRAQRTALRTVSLPDGSRVTLDREAIVRIAFSKRERFVRLVRGRARFDVAHETRRPFVVDAGNGSVIAHGTVFDVALEGSIVRVILVQGAVEVRRQDARSSSIRRSRMLSPGQQLVIGSGALAQPAPASSDALVWASDMIVFDATPLSDAIAAYNRTGSRAVRLAASGRAKRPLSGAFRRGDSEAFAQAVAVSFALAVDHDPGGAIVLADPSAEGS